MATRQRKVGASINKENILLASIPVLGSIIIAFFSTDKFQCHRDIKLEVDNSISTALKSKAGMVNDMIVYRRYNDLAPLMVDGLKPVITEKVFNAVADSTERVLGSFIKPIDTTQAIISGNANFYIKNQFQRGTNINQIIFDDKGRVYGIFCNFSPN